MKVETTGRLPGGLNFRVIYFFFSGAGGSIMTSLKEEASPASP